MTAAEYRTLREEARARIDDRQRFDRDAVKRMLAGAMNATCEHCYYIRVENGLIVSEDRSKDRYWNETFDGDRLADTVIEWFGGKGAA